LPKQTIFLFLSLLTAAALNSLPATALSSPNPLPQWEKVVRLLTLDNLLTAQSAVQYNAPDTADADISPRFAAIAQINEHWGAKFMYGKAFRQASPVERLISAPTVVGNAALEPEKIETIDVQIFYNSDRVSFAVTYFHSEQDDLITRIGALPQLIVNAGKIE